MSDLKCMGESSPALQIIFDMQSQMTRQKREVKKIHFLNCKRHFFDKRIHFDPPYFQTS
jgi:hypothetical protein